MHCNGMREVNSLSKRREERERDRETERERQRDRERERDKERERERVERDLQSLLTYRLIYHWQPL